MPPFLPPLIFKTKKPALGAGFGTLLRTGRDSNYCTDKFRHSLKCATSKDIVFY